MVVRFDYAGCLATLFENRNRMQRVRAGKFACRNSRHPGSAAGVDALGKKTSIGDIHGTNPER